MCTHAQNICMKTTKTDMKTTKTDEKLHKLTENTRAGIQYPGTIPGISEARKFDYYYVDIIESFDYVTSYRELSCCPAP